MPLARRGLCPTLGRSIRLLTLGIIFMLAIIKLRSHLHLRAQNLARANMERKEATLPRALDITVADLAEALDARHFSSADLVATYLARISETSEFNAVLEINPNALAEAKTLDEERSRMGSRGPLHGVPILVKDNIVTKDDLEASAGSFALVGAKPPNESSVIARLRKAGVIILGKTNMSEWANFRGLKIPGGWSPRGGQTKGTYVPDQQSEGSSSGSAAATTLGLCVAALGTETFGSILDPAEAHSLVGFKPTRGLIGNDGAIPISRRQDVIGTLTRTVKDAAYLLSQMAGKSETDERTWTIPFPTIPDYPSCCGSTDLTGIAVGVPRNTFESKAAPLLASFESALDTLRAAGATVVENANFTAADEFKKLNQEVKGIVRSSEFKRDIVAYLRTLSANPNDLHSAEDVIQYTKKDPREDFPAKDIGKFLWTQAEGINVDSEKYRHMVKQEIFFGGEGGILGAMDAHNVDVLVVPSILGIANDLAAKMGFPAICVPLGFWPEGTPIQKKGDFIAIGPGVPYGLTIITKAFADATLLRVAHALDVLLEVRKNGPSPYKLPLTELQDLVRKAQKM